MLYGTPIEEREPEGATTRSRASARPTARRAAAGSCSTTTLFDDTGSLGYLDLDAAGRDRARRDRRARARGRRRARGTRAPRRRSLRRCTTTSTAARGCTRRVRRGGAVVRRSSACSSARASSRAASSTGSTTTQGSGRFVAVVLHRDDARRSSTCSPADDDAAGAHDARARARPRAGAARRPERTRRSSRTTACASRPGSTFRRRSSDTTAPRPLVYYVHGGPQSQERPNFAWFSMPLIQILTLEGFAVFVPNARGSTGYGLDYTKRVDRDWGGLDRLDHVHAMTEVLPQRRARGRRAGRRRRSLVRRLHDADARGAASGALARGRRHVRAVRPASRSWSGSRRPGSRTSRSRSAIRRRDRDFLVERSPKTHIARHLVPAARHPGSERPARRRARVARRRRGASRARQGRRLPRLRGRGPRRAEARETASAATTRSSGSSPSICVIGC